MTVKDLRKILEQYPDDTEVVTHMCSDLVYLEKPELLKGVRNSGGWIEDYDPNSWKGESPVVEDFLYFMGK